VVGVRSVLEAAAELRGAIAERLDCLHLGGGEGLVHLIYEIPDYRATLGAMPLIDIHTSLLLRPGRLPRIIPGFQNGLELGALLTGRFRIEAPCLLLRGHIIWVQDGSLGRFHFFAFRLSQ
jgi:hypothetical protein